MKASTNCLQVEGTCDGDHGYVVAVLQITGKSRGMLKDTTGFASYTVTYTCMVLRPFRGEVMDVLVTSVSKVTAWPSPQAKQCSFFWSSDAELSKLRESHDCNRICF